MVPAQKVSTQIARVPRTYVVEKKGVPDRNIGVPPVRKYANYCILLDVHEFHFVITSYCIGHMCSLDELHYTRKNAQVVTGLQTSCYKFVHKLSTSCVRTACSLLL
jgi:hypothetical protein